MTDLQCRLLSGIFTGLAIFYANVFLDLAKRYAAKSDALKLVDLSFNKSIEASSKFLEGLQREDRRNTIGESPFHRIYDLFEVYRENLSGDPFESQIIESIKLFDGKEFDMLTLYISTSSNILIRLLNACQWLDDARKSEDSSIRDVMVMTSMQESTKYDAQIMLMLSISFKSALSNAVNQEEKFHNVYTSAHFLDNDKRKEHPLARLTYERDKSLIESYIEPRYQKIKRR
jgi:hypothetical protein